MNFDQILFLLIAICGGFLSGFLSVKVNHLLVIITGRLLSSGHAQRRYIIIGTAATVLFFILYLVFTSSSGLLFGIVLSVIFAACFTVGIFFAEKRFSEALLILHQIISAMYTDSLNGNEITDDAFSISSQTLDEMLPSNKEAFLLLVMFFDSRFTVFFISLFVGRYLSTERFIHMSPADQDKYLETWASNQYLSLIVQALKSITSLTYFTSHLSWHQIDYQGEVLKRSYLN